MLDLLAHSYMLIFLSGHSSPIPGFNYCLLCIIVHVWVQLLLYLHYRTWESFIISQFFIMRFCPCTHVLCLIFVLYISCPRVDSFFLLPGQQSNLNHSWIINPSFLSCFLGLKPTMLLNAFFPFIVYLLFN